MHWQNAVVHGKLSSSGFVVLPTLFGNVIKNILFRIVDDIEQCRQHKIVQSYLYEPEQADIFCHVQRLI